MILPLRRKRIVLRACALFAAALLITITTARPAQANVIFAESEGYGLHLDVSMPGFAALIDKAAATSGSGGSPYSDLNFVFGAGATVGPLIDATTAAIAGNVSSDVDGAPGSRSVLGAGGVSGVVLNILPGVTPALGLTVTGIAAISEITGDYGALVATGTTQLIGLTIDVGGVPLVIPVNPAPNTLLFSGGGIDILLNEQTITGDGISTAGASVNAVHIIFTGAGGVVDGDIILGHSSAGATAVVPEPASMSLLVIGSAVMLFRRRRELSQAA